MVIGSHEAMVDSDEDDCEVRSKAQAVPSTIEAEFVPLARLMWKSLALKAVRNRHAKSFQAWLRLARTQQVADAHSGLFQGQNAIFVAAH